MPEVEEVLAEAEVADAADVVAVEDDLGLADDEMDVDVLPGLAGEVVPVLDEAPWSDVASSDAVEEGDRMETDDGMHSEFTVATSRDSASDREP